jgi:hypothetical protein
LYKLVHELRDIIDLSCRAAILDGESSSFGVTQISETLP